MAEIAKSPRVTAPNVGQTNVLTLEMARSPKVPAPPKTANLGRDIRTLKPLRAAEKREAAERVHYAWQDGSELSVQRGPNGEWAYAMLREPNDGGTFNHFFARDGKTVTHAQVASGEGFLEFTADENGALVEVGGSGAHFGLTSQGDVDRVGRQVDHRLISGAQITTARFLDTNRDGRFDHMRLAAVVPKPLNLGWRKNGT